MALPTAGEFFRLDGTGTVRFLSTVSSTGADATTVARYEAGGTTTSRRFVPATAVTADTAVPSSGTAASGNGWRQEFGVNASEAVRFAAGAWAVRLDLKRSGQTLEQDQNSDVTVILYRVTSAGTHLLELGRATVRLTWTATNVEHVFTVTPLGSPQFNADDRLQIEVYVVALDALNNPAAPAVATDLQFIVDDGGAASSRVSLPDHNILYARAPADTAGAVDTFSQSAGTFARAAADDAPAADAATRTYIQNRPTHDAIGPDAVDPVYAAGRRLAGVVRDNEGAPVGGATVKLVRQADDRVVRTQTTAADGIYSFDRDTEDAGEYYVMSYTATTPQTKGLSDRGLVPAAVPAPEPEPDPNPVVVEQ